MRWIPDKEAKSGFEPGQCHLGCVLGKNTPTSPLKFKRLQVDLFEAFLQNAGCVVAGGVEILRVPSCYANRDKFLSCEPLYRMLMTFCLLFVLPVPVPHC